jgi:hypothetical protein
MKYNEWLNEQKFIKEAKTISVNMTLDELFKAISKEVPTLNAMIKKTTGYDPGLKIRPLSISRGYLNIDFDAKSYGSKDCGIMGLGIKNVELTTYGQCYISESSDSITDISQKIWFRLKLDYQHPGGGSNGTSVYVNGDEISYTYDVEEGKFEELRR